MNDLQGFDDFFPENEDEEFPLGENEDFPESGGEDEEMPTLAEDEAERSGNRTFVLLAIVMIILFVIGLVAVLFLAIRPQPVTDAELTATYVVAYNATQSDFANQTMTANAILGITQTYIIEHPSPTPTASATILPTVTWTPTIDPTIQAGTQFVGETETAVSLNATIGAAAGAAQQTLIAGITQTAQAFQTANPVQPTATPTLSINDVNMTATALVGFFLTATAQAGGQGGGATQIVPGFGSPTAESFGPSPTPGLPNTGIFDDIATGGRGGIGLLAIAAFGLVGVIVVSRRLRTRSDK